MAEEGRYFKELDVALAPASGDITAAGKSATRQWTPSASGSTAGEAPTLPCPELGRSALVGGNDERWSQLSAKGARTGRRADSLQPSITGEEAQRGASFTRRVWKVFCGTTAWDRGQVTERLIPGGQGATMMSGTAEKWVGNFWPL